MPVCDVSLHGNIWIRVDVCCRQADRLGPSHPVHVCSAFCCPHPGTGIQDPRSTVLVLSFAVKGSAVMEGELLGCGPSLVSLHVILPTSSGVDLDVTGQQRGCRIVERHLARISKGQVCTTQAAKTNPATLTPSIGSYLVMTEKTLGSVPRLNIGILCKLSN